MLIVIFTTSDGLHIVEHNEEDFEDQLNTGGWAQVTWHNDVHDFNEDAAYNGLIIQGGKVVCPEPVQQDTRYKLK